ncbi:MAG: hybrid sensor histidine kinase/response regulator, partial [Alphaproteobacteria bacterium]
MDDLLQEFLAETNEGLSDIEVDLVRLEQSPDDPSPLTKIFRVVHSIKGACGFLGLSRLEKLAHAAESVLSKLRDGALPVTPEIVTVVLSALDRVKAILVAISQDGTEPDGDDDDLIGQLSAITQGPPAAATEATTEAAPETDPAVAQDTAPADAAIADDDTGAAAQPAPPARPAKATPTKAAKGKPDRAKAAAPAAVEKSAASSVRVAVTLLEKLMDTTSELVLTRNQLMQLVRSGGDSRLATPLQHLNQITTELQEAVMKTRMQPIGNAWSTLPRMVRDLAHQLDKKIELQTFGAETELDRHVLELIKDPLNHMVRNAADHGLETTQGRRAAGKPETGQVTLSARHEGGHIIIELADDGPGIKLEKLREKVLRAGLATEAELEAITEQQLMQFIFKPGLSTAEKVSNVSGRGVGLDVVKSNIEQIGGTVEIQSVVGRGTTFTLKIPLTLAIVSAIIVECAGQRFAVPEINVVELVRASDSSEHRIERLQGTNVLRLRDRLLPLLDLRTLLKIGVTAESPAQITPPATGQQTEQKNNGGTSADDAFIVVAQVGTYSFGVIVDRVFDTEEIVVKPVAPVLRDLKIYSGNTILGDGSTIMILDPNAIASSTGEITIGVESQLQAERDGDGRSEKELLLLFSAGKGGPKAVPLALVTRLEEFPVERLEQGGDGMAIQYRGHLMPLIPFEPGMTLASDANAVQQVLVFGDDENSMGLMVNQVIDIVEERLRLDLQTRRPGIMGSAVIAGKATEIVDASHWLGQSNSDWYKRPRSQGDRNQRKRRSILLVDDSPFFLNLLRPLLRAADYDVTTADKAEAALDILNQGHGFDLIISDIEMPDLNGLEFARQ